MPYLLSAPVWLGRQVYATAFLGARVWRAPPAGSRVSAISALLQAALSPVHGRS
jgi:hypothetical protein